MADKLPWFKFFVQDYITDKRVLRLNNEQRGIYVWLLCRQWQDGSLPYDVHEVYPLLPPGSESPAVAYILTEFFPADPDTNARRNPKLAEQQDKMQSIQAVREANLTAARAAKSLRYNTASIISPDTSSDMRGRNRDRNREKKKDGPSAPDATQEFLAQWRRPRG